MFPTDVVIVVGARTPMARYNGVFRDLLAIDLGVGAAREAIRRVARACATAWPRRASAAARALP